MFRGQEGFHWQKTQVENLMLLIILIIYCLSESIMSAVMCKSKMSWSLQKMSAVFWTCYQLSEHVFFIYLNTCCLQVSGFPVFGTAQPTEEGFLRLLDKIPKVRRGVPPPSRQDTQGKGSGWYTDKRLNDKRQNDKHQNEKHRNLQTSEQFYPI